MTPWNPDWRPWLYALAWMAGGIALTAFAIWLVVLVRYNWPADRAEQQLGILAIALYMVLTGPLLVMLGLGMRNAIRNLKASGAGFSAEVSGHDSVTVATETTVTREDGQ